MGELRIIIPPELHKRLKQRAVDRGISIKELVPEIIRDYLCNADPGAQTAEKNAPVKH